MKGKNTQRTKMESPQKRKEKHVQRFSFSAFMCSLTNGQVKISIFQPVNRVLSRLPFQHPLFQVYPHQA